MPHEEHLQALRRACAQGHLAFDEGRDVVPHASLASLRRALAVPGAPVAVLHVLCHGGRLASGTEVYGLVWDASEAGEPSERIGPLELRKLLAPHAGTLRLVVLAACHGASAGAPGNALGGVAQALHRIGVPAVVASRQELSVEGSIAAATVLYDWLLVGLASLESAFLAAREKVAEDATHGDWAALQLYARAADGSDHRPFVFAPYRGLLPFERRDARFFFGRDGKDKGGKDREVDKLVGEVEGLAGTKGSARFVVVAGDSGTGKSSMVLAGAMPRLEEKGWVWGSMRPGSVPMATLDAALAALDAKLKEKRDAGERARSLLVVDQFEEVFTSVAKAEDRTAFVRSLWERASLPDDGCPSVIIVMRIDFLGRCGEILLDKERGLRLDKVACDPAHQVLVAQMESDQLRDAIEAPARTVGLALESGLTRRILEGADREPGALPMMQHTMCLLWEKRQDRTLTQASYDAFEGLTGALNKHADEVIKSFDDEKQRLARRLLVRLVNMGDGDTLDTRKRVRLGELRPRGSTEAARFDEVLHKLVNRRLLVCSGKGEQQTVEIAHEALIRKWKWLGEWLEEERGRLLSLAVRRRLKQLVAVAAIAVAVAALMGVLVLWALGQRDVARTASRMAGARGLLVLHRALPASMVLATVKDAEKVQGWAELATDTLVYGMPRSTLRHERDVLFAAWSPDGKRIATASLDNTARVWNADGQGDPIVLRGDGCVITVAWSPDGKRIVTASEDKTARVWNADGQGDPIVLRGHESDVNSAAWSPDGRRIATASLDNTARVWNADGQEEPIVLEGHEGLVSSVAWSPDGKRIVTASEDKTARVWNADGQGDPVVLKGHQNAVLSAAWSPDGKRIVTASLDTTARVWNADGQGDPIVLKGHENAVLSALRHV